MPRALLDLVEHEAPSGEYAAAFGVARVPHHGAQVRDLKLRTAAQRLGCYLLARVKDGEAVKADFRLPFDKGLLAARLGCRQENLSRAFATLRDLRCGDTRLARDPARHTTAEGVAVPDELSEPEPL